jgi:hypothetical protein
VTSEPVEHPTHTLQDCEEGLTDRYTVTGTEQDWFRKWRDALDPVSQRIVDRRLQQVADGNFGDWRKLSSIDAA